MSTLSKVLVVLLVLLAIAHSAVLLAYLSQQEDWKRTALAEQEALANARASLNSQKIAHQQAQAQFTEDRKGFETKLAQLESRYNRDQTEKGLLQNRIGTLTAEKETLQRDVTQLTANLSIALKAQEHITKQIDTARNTANKLQVENTQLEDQLAQLTRDVTVLRDDVRSKKERIASLQSEIRRAQGIISAKVAPPVTTALPPTVATAQPIRGRVTDVDLASNLVQINVGEIAGVAKGTRFIIYSNNQYVGDLNVTRVLRDQSVGSIVLSSDARTVRIGDEVATKLK